MIESPLLSLRKRRRCKAWAVLRFFLFLLLLSVAPCTNRQKVREKKKEGLSAGSKRAMHSLHHHDVTRPSRPRQVVSCSSRSDGSKKRTEPTKEVKSLICQTKQGGFLFSYFSLSTFFFFFFFSFFFFTHSQSIHVPECHTAYFLRRNPTRNRIATSEFEPEQTTLQTRITSIRDLRPSGYAIFPRIVVLERNERRRIEEGSKDLRSTAPKKDFHEIWKIWEKRLVLDAREI